VRRWVAGVAACTLVLLAACSDDRGGSDTTSDSTDAEEPTETSETLTEFGSLDFPCGPQDGGGELPTGDPAETFGITDAGIPIGTFSDPGYQSVPGLNQEIFDATEAFVEECNAAGGINGRPIDLTLRDAKLLEYPGRVEEACASDFAVVGGGNVLDDTGAQRLTDCGLVSIAGYSPTAKGALADNIVLPIPIEPNRRPVGGLLALEEQLEEDGLGLDLEPEDVTTHAGILYGEIQTTIDVYDQYKKAAEAVGWEFVYEQSYNVTGEANWAPFAQAIADAGVQFLTFVGSPDFFIQLQEAMDQQGLAPPIIMQEGNFYDIDYSTGIAGLNPDTVNLVRTVYWPFELADANPATAAYLALLDEHVPDAVPAGLGVQSMSAWLLFAGAAAECDRNNDLTRSCVYDTAKATTEWTGGGLHATAYPNEGGSPQCSLLLEVQDGEFALWRAPGETPDDAYYCSDEGLVDIEGSYGEGATRSQ
jgi:hypothetical protein